MNFVLLNDPASQRQQLVRADHISAIQVSKADRSITLVLLGGQAIGSPAVGWLIDQVGARPSMFACGALVALVALGSGLAMARSSHLTVEVDVHRDRGRAPLHIVHS